MGLSGILQSLNQTLHQWDRSLSTRQRDEGRWISKNFPAFKTVTHYVKVREEDYAIQKLVKYPLFFVGLCFLKLYSYGAAFCSSLAARVTSSKKPHEPGYEAVDRPLQQSFVEVEPSDSSNGESNGGYEVVNEEKKESPSSKDLHSHARRGGRRHRHKRPRGIKTLET